MMEEVFYYRCNSKDKNGIELYEEYMYNIKAVKTSGSNKKSGSEGKK